MLITLLSLSVASEPNPADLPHSIAVQDAPAALGVDLESAGNRTLALSSVVPDRPGQHYVVSVAQRESSAGAERHEVAWGHLVASDNGSLYALFTVEASLEADLEVSITSVDDAGFEASAPVRFSIFEDDILMRTEVNADDLLTSDALDTSTGIIIDDHLL